MRLLLITPYYPYPAEKTGGTHTINFLIKNISDYVIDIFYYGENRLHEQEVRFSKNINEIHYEDLRCGSLKKRIKSIFYKKTYSSYMYKKNSTILEDLLNKKNYDLIILDQYSSMNFNLQIESKTILFMHDSYPLLFSRKKKIAKGIGKIYYELQRKYSIEEEKDNYGKYKKIIFVSSKDIKEEVGIHPEHKEKFHVCNLGIDLKEVREASEVQMSDNSLVFTGVMDYEPNEDAMIYFINNVFTKVKNTVPNVTLYIVGKNPTKRLLDCVAEEESIVVTGKVESVFSYIKSATIYVSPLRMGSGKKNKIIEAMACQVPIIASDVSLDGFDDLETTDLIKHASSDEEWVNQIVNLLNDTKEQNRIKSNMSNLINESYNWERIAENLMNGL